MGVNISAPYIYVCTRMRMRKSKLLPKEEYQRMLNMSVSEITRIIGESEYKQEIDELGTTFKGIDLVEVALSWNLAKEYQKIQEITPGTLKQFTQVYLRSWDIQNVLTILRGKMQGVRAGKIKEILVPAGSLDKVSLDRILSEESPDRIIEMLKDHRMFPVLAREYPLAKESGSFSRMENELYKHLYANIINDAKSGVKGGASFLAYIQLEIDIKNVKTLFRLRADKVDEEAKEMFIPGGSLSIADFTSLNAVRDLNEFIDMVRANISNDTLHVLLDEVRAKQGGVQYIEAKLTRVQLEQMEKMSKRNPFSIHPILVYLEKKKYEVFNLRALARGKESNLPSEKIVDYLVM